MKITQINKEMKVLSRMNSNENIDFEHFLRRAMKFTKALEEQYSNSNMGFITGLYDALNNTYFTRQNVEEKQSKITRDNVLIAHKGSANDVAHNYMTAPVKYINAIHNQGVVDQYPLTINMINDNDWIDAVELVTYDNDYDKKYVMNQIKQEINELKCSDFETQGLKTV